MSNPILRVRLAIKCSVLDVYTLVRCVEIQIAYSGSLVGDLVRYTNRLKEGRDDEVDVLAWVRKEADVGEEGEGCHSAGIVVARESVCGAVEAGGYVYDFVNT